MKPSEILHRIASTTEDAVDIVRRRIWQRMGRNTAQQIVAFRGYQNAANAWLSGRVLANRPGGGPLDDDSWRENLLNTYRRWESDEVPFTDVIIRYANCEVATRTDEEGYYHAEFPAITTEEAGISWHTASVRAGAAGTEIHAVHEVMVGGVGAEYGVISDLDDTVIHTGITSLLMAAKLTFLENAKTRKPLDGVAELYQSFRQGAEGAATNPIFYISSSPWNLHDLLEDFLKLNDIPAGPLLLRDVGLDSGKPATERGHGHKLEKALCILDRFPGLPFVLVGDSGQEDPAIYAEVVSKRPGRVKAIYIRDVDPDLVTERDHGVGRLVMETVGRGVPMLHAIDSRAISLHALGLGLIRERAVGKVAAEVVRDIGRPDLSQQAVSDAVGAGETIVS